MSDLDDMLVAAGAPPVHADEITEIALDIDKEGRARKSTSSPTPKKADVDADKAPTPKPDRYIVGFYVALCIISVIELYSASSREVMAGNIFGPLLRHLMMLAMGILICIGVSRVKVKYFVMLTPIFVTISTLMMVYVLLNGQIINGARRSFSLIGIQIQPAELLKISAVLIIAYIMSRNQEKRGVKTSGVIWCVAWVSAFSLLLISQGLTNTLLLMIISLSMMLIGGVQFRKFFVVCMVYSFAVGGVLFYKLNDHEEINTEVVNTGTDANGNRQTLNRAGTWKNRISRYSSDIPLYEQPITSENRQEMYAYMAQANGGVFGVFPGNSRETARLPLAFSDYIYSIVVEDTGFVGGVLLLFIYLSLLARAAFIASRCDRAFPAMLVTGMAVMICFQALFHMAIVTGVFPVSGQPLPMISKGGTSMLVTSLAFGIMLSVSRYSSSGSKKATKETNVELPQELDAANPMKYK